MRAKGISIMKFNCKIFKKKTKRKIDFQKKFMLAIVDKEKETMKFLDANFREIANNINEKSMNIEFQSQLDKINEIKALSEIEKQIAKARLKELVEANDASKSLPTNMAIIASVLFTCNMLLNSKYLKDVNINEFFLWWILFLIGALICIVAYYLKKHINYRKTAIYISELLEDSLKTTNEDK